MILLLTDTHLHKNNIGQNKSIFIQAKQYCIANKIKHIFHMGDAFDSRIAQPLEVLNTFGDIIEIFKDTDIEILFIPGNHDKTSYNSKKSYLDEFKYHPNFSLLDDGCATTFENQKEFRIYSLPFFSKNIYTEKLEQLIYSNKHYLTNKNYVNILLTHIDINGVKNNDGSIVENGIGQDMFKYFDKVFVGHYHNRQIIDKKFIYIGSAFPHNFGEDNEKGFCFLKEDGSYEFIKTEFHKYVTKNIDTSQSIEELKLWKKENSNDNLRVIIKDDESKIKSFNKSLIEDIGIEVKMKENEIEEGVKVAKEGKAISFNKEDIKKEFEKFGKLNKIKDISTGKKYLKKLFNE